MPWYAPWSDHIAKRVCKYLLQRYLGQYLEEKLTLDQLNVDLYQGIGTITDVTLDVLALNELAESQKLPIEFTDGFIEEMSVSIPWTALLRDSSDITVTGLSLNVKYKERDKSKSTMFESMWSSMSSSMQIAEDCLRNEKEESPEDNNQSFEGIERFAHTIDSILTRIRLKLHKTVLRLEEIDGSAGVAVEARIEYMEYWDEAGERPVDENTPPELIVPVLSTKHFQLDGVSFYTDEFKVSSSQTPSPSPFPFHDEFQSAHESLNRSTSSTSTIEDSIERYDSNCVLMGKLAGRQEVALNFKHEAIAGPKIELILRLGAFTAFLSPRQVHKLIWLVSFMTTAHEAPTRRRKGHLVQQPMHESDFRKIENELLTNLNQGYPPSQALNSRGWGNSSMDDSCDFLPINTTMSRCNESVLSSMSSLGSSTSSMGSSRSSLSQPAHLDIRSTFSGDVDNSSTVFRFHVSLSSVAVVLLHNDILVLPASTTPTDTGTATSASLQAMRSVADQFFAKLGLFAVSGFGNKDFHDAKKVFLDACQHNHLRFLAAPVIFEGSETAASRGSVLKGSMSAASLQLLECLVEKNSLSSQPVAEYIELITFSNHKEEKIPQFEALPNMKLDFKLHEATSRRDKGRKINQSRSQFSLTLQPMEVDFDITIIDRISTLLSMEPLAPKTVPKGNKFEAGIRSAVDNTVSATTCNLLQIIVSRVLFKIRFPVPDLRPLHDMERAPWWRRHVRPETLLFDITDLMFSTCLDPLDPVLKYEIECRNLIALFQEGENVPAVPFVTIGSDPATNTMLDGGRGFGWPRLVISFHPQSNNIDLAAPEPAFTAQSMGHMSLIAALERTQQREVSPFSFQKVIHDGHGDGGVEGEDLVTPASKEQVAEFIELASNHSLMRIDIFCPTASVLLSSKRLYELIYNRLTMDLIMWKSSAPVRETPNALSLSLADNSPLQPTFNLCKSGIHYESDSDESEDGLFFSVAEQKERHRKKKAVEDAAPLGQNRISVCLTVGQGLCDLYLPVRDSLVNVIPEQSGELLLSVDELTYYYVSGFNAKRDLDYMCVQANHASLYHNGMLGESSVSRGLRNVGSVIPHYLLPTISRMDVSACTETPCEPVGIGSAQSMDMLTAAVKISRDENNRSLKASIILLSAGHQYFTGGPRSVHPCSTATVLDFLFYEHHLCSTRSNLVVRQCKFFRVALGLRHSSLRYRVCETRNAWFNQLIDFFDVDDYPIAGYEPSTVVTELNLHLWNCNIDYRPLYLPLRAVLNLASFNLSSNIASKTHSSTLRLIAEDASLFISDKMGHRPQTTPVNLRKDYVCVVQLGLFDLFVRLCELSLSNPRVDLRSSANGLIIRTCSDSAKALLELLTYFASDGDVHGAEQTVEPTPPVDLDQVLIDTSDEPTQLLSKSQVDRVHDLMEEAMVESRLDSHGGVTAFFTPDSDIVESVDITVEDANDEYESPQLGSELFCDYELDDSWESEFCILENEAGIGILPRSGLPEVRQLTADAPRLVDNHFALPTGRTDHLKSPKHYPKPVARYTLRELSLLWQMYGGSDFDPPPPAKHVNIVLNDDEKVAGTSAISFSKSSPSAVRFEAPFTPSNASKVGWQEQGGLARRHDILMELQLNKVQFQHEVYPEGSAEASRQVLLIKDLEFRDRLASSQINKFLYQYYSEAKPKQAHAHMVVVKSLQSRADPKMSAQECSLKISLLPLRLNIDQDSLLFLVQFFTELSDKEEETEEAAQVVTSRHSTPTHAPPVMSITVEGKTSEPAHPPAPPLIQFEDPRPTPRTKSKPKKVSNATKPPSPPVYFKCVIFSPEVHVKLDYQGKHVDLTHGPLAGILMGLGQLNNSELRLKRISHRHGLLGFDKLAHFVLNEWSSDIKRNQLPGLLGGVGPIYSLVQLFQGLRDLFWMPIEQYQRDGRLVRGIQRGANSFTTSSAMAFLELTSRLIQIIQSTAETAYDLVSPGPSVRAQRRSKNKRRQYSQPADIREGVANAILVVKDGIGEAAVNLVRVASEEHEQKGVTGAVGGVLRQIPPTVVKPIILASEATNNVIGGMRSQLMPDVRKEAVDKWRGNT